MIDFSTTPWAVLVVALWVLAVVAYVLIAALRWAGSRARRSLGGHVEAAMLTPMPYRWDDRTLESVAEDDPEMRAILDAALVSETGVILVIRDGDTLMYREDNDEEWRDLMRAIEDESAEEEDHR